MRTKDEKIKKIEEKIKLHHTFLINLFTEVRKDAIRERSKAKEKQDKENQECKSANRPPPH